jgi:ribonuclease P protein component
LFRNRLETLKTQREFDRVFKEGRRLYGKHISMIALKNGGAKIGIIVNKKYGNAAQRNRFKRVAREAFRKLDPAYYEMTDIVIIPRSSGEVGPEDVFKDLEHLLAPFRSRTA